MKLCLAFGALLLAGCTTPPPPLDASTREAAVVELAFAVSAAAELCSAVANRLDGKRGRQVVDGCINALIPAQDAIVFVEANSTSAGCMGKAVRVALERTRDVLAPVQLPGLVLDGIRLGKKLEAYALPTCDPLHPTGSTTVWVDPNIANVYPEYPR